MENFNMAEFLIFNAFIILLLLLDLGIFHKKSHEVSVRESLTWTAIWIAVAMLFSGYVYYAHGGRKAMEYITGYVIEKTLSVDNMFVFLTIFASFAIAKVHQHKVLFWGIVLAMLLRGGFIFAGIKLIETFHWLIYVFGGFLIYTGIKIYLDRNDHEEKHPEDNFFIKFLEKHLPITSGLDGDKFHTKINGKFKFTRLFLAFLAINFADVVFAFDSIPAIFAITLDPFIVYTSNIFAILGLRALYFALAGVASMFHYVNHALAVILCFVGFKMLAAEHMKIDPLVSLAIILTILAVAIVMSLEKTKRDKQKIGGKKGW